MNKIKTSAGKNKYFWDYGEFRYLVKVLGQTKKLSDLVNLLLELLTPQEVAELIRRVIMASLLAEGKTYQEIKDLTGASSTTIAKIQAKFYKEQSSLGDAIKKTDSFEDFIKTPLDDRDELSRYIDSALSKRSLGLFGRK